MTFLVLISTRLERQKVCPESCIYYSHATASMAHVSQLVLACCSGKRYLLHIEAAHLLVVLTSTQLYTPAASSPAGTHPFLDSIMQQTQLAPQLVQQSLHHFINRPPQPSGIQLWSPSQDTRNGVLHLVRSAAGARSYYLQNTSRPGLCFILYASQN